MFDKTRNEKAEKIVELYGSRKWRQEDIANHYNIPIAVVRKVAQIYGFEHGKEKSFSSPNNMNEEQTISPIILNEDLSFLDKYDLS